MLLQSPFESRRYFGPIFTIWVKNQNGIVIFGFVTIYKQFLPTFYSFEPFFLPNGLIQRWIELVFVVFTRDSCGFQRYVGCSSPQTCIFITQHIG
jgi:hypothetical protein